MSPPFLTPGWHNCFITQPMCTWLALFYLYLFAVFTHVIPFFYPWSLSAKRVKVENWW